MKRELVRGIGFLDATALVVGSMIGSGIFIVSAKSARVLGSGGWLLAAWAIAGVLTMIAALCCSELAAMMPKAGGQYVFFREAYGPLFGFLFGWTMFLVIQTGTIAAVAVAFAKFLGVVWPAVTEAKTRIGPFSVSAAQGVGVAVIAILTASNANGLKTGTATQNVFTFAKLAALLALTICGLLLGREGAALRASGFWEAVAPEGRALTGAALVAALGTAMVGPLFSQSAWNNVTFAGEEVEAPGRTLPRALLAGCLLVTSLYVLANVAYLNVLPLSAIQNAPSDRVATAVATSLFGPAAAGAMAIAIMVSTFGCVNGLILSGARVSFAMARDGLFFRGLQRLNSAAVPAQRAVGAGAVGLGPRSLRKLQRPAGVRDLGRHPLLRSARHRGHRPASQAARPPPAVPRAGLPVPSPALRGCRGASDRDPSRCQPPDDVARICARRHGRAGLLPLAAARRFVKLESRDVSEASFLVEFPDLPDPDANRSPSRSRTG